MFEAKDVIGDAAKRAVALFESHTRGDVVPWQAVFAAAGFDRNSPHWTQFNKRFRRDFREKTGIVVWPVNGVGLKLLTPKEQLEIPLARRQSRALRQVRRGLKELAALPVELLSDHEQEVRRRKLDQARAASRAVLYSVRLGHKLLKPTDNGIPRPKPKAA